jgi:hypothetical protein
MLLTDVLGAQEEVQAILEDKISPKKKRTRIEGVQTRLTNLLVLHFGTVILEV